jgi:putative flavoprotein involved in K+ transport
MDAHTYRGTSILRDKYDEVVIGAGGAGLATSYHLKRLGVEHVVLERGRAGETWLANRWDSFTLVNPNWAVRLPGFHYSATDPDGYLPRDEVVEYLRRYAKSFDAPIREGVDVRYLERTTGGGYRMATTDGDICARIVVVATGAFGIPAKPAFADRMSPRVTQLHSNEYRSASQLPPGAVLVVGSGQSGAQIAEDLMDAGRKVYLSVSRAGRRPRRYRGRDSSWWNNEMGAFDRTADDVASIHGARFSSSSHTSGTKGGHDIYLRAMSRDGAVLLGRLEDADGERLRIADDLHENLNAADEHAAKWREGVDRWVEEHGLDFPAEPEPDPPGLYAYPKGEPIRILDMAAAGISTVIWATGFRYDFSWIRLPIAGPDGFPVQSRGVTAFRGLYFVGLQWMYSAKSAQFIGVGEDAEYVARHIADRIQRY